MLGLYWLHSFDAVWRQKKHPAFKTWVMSGRDYLSENWSNMQKWFADGSADATATLLPLATLKSWMVYISDAMLTQVFEERGR